jgi:hypothetical protein
VDLWEPRTEAHQEAHLRGIGTGSDQMMLNRVASGGTARRDPDLAIHGCQVGVECTQNDDQALGHLCVGQTLRDQMQDLFLLGVPSIRKARGGMEGKDGLRSC